MTLSEIIKKLEGQSIKRILTNPSYDCGLIIITNNGDRLEFAYSSCEGNTWFNNVEIKELS